MTARTLLKTLEYQIDFSEIDLKNEFKESAQLHKGDLLKTIVADYRNGFYYIPFNRQIYYYPYLMPFCQYSSKLIFYFSIL
jgi:hypothetical protein